MTRTWTVVVGWKDGPVEDADEVTVVAGTAAGATSAARRIWRLTIGAEWPRCEIVEVSVLQAVRRKRERFD